MFKDRLRKGVQLHHMMKTCPNIRRSVLALAERIITLVHAERYDPATLEFLAQSPYGEPDKMLLVLERAEYASAPIHEREAHPSESSYQLTGFVDSLYKAIVGYNGAMEGFFLCCPGLATAIFVVAAYIHERWYLAQGRDMVSHIVWDTYDWWVTGDLLITGIIHG